MFIYCPLEMRCWECVRNIGPFGYKQKTLNSKQKKQVKKWVDDCLILKIEDIKESPDSVSIRIIGYSDSVDTGVASTWALKRAFPVHQEVALYLWQKSDYVDGNWPSDWFFLFQNTAKVLPDLRKKERSVEIRLWIED